MLNDGFLVAAVWETDWMQYIKGGVQLKGVKCQHRFIVARNTTEGRIGPVGRRAVPWKGGAELEEWRYIACWFVLVLTHFSPFLAISRLPLGNSLWPHYSSPCHFPPLSRLSGLWFGFVKCWCEVLWASVKGPCLHRPENWFMRQLIDEAKRYRK
jgi:hypothetical protein